MIIAEIGVNHNGNKNVLKELMRNCFLIRPDAIKFQYWQKDRFPEIANLRLSKKLLKECFETVEKEGLVPFATGFDLESLDVLEDLGQEIWKIPSGMTTNKKFLGHIKDKKGLHLFSTGLTNIDEIQAGLDILDSNRDNTMLLHCVSNYPTDYRDANINSMVSYEKQFLLDYGLSSHVPDIYDAIAATALGAKVIEKHITLDRKMVGPDHKSSLEPDEFMEMISAIRKVKRCLGESFKTLTKQEKSARKTIRKNMAL